MKKALVLSLVLALGLGLTAFAQAWEGTWDTDISVRPAAATFGDFIQGFDSDLDVAYTIADWDFEVQVDFNSAGMDGLDFNIDGALGAFTFDIDLDFEPMLLVESVTTFVGLVAAQTPSFGACLQTNSWAFVSMATANSYVAAFDDLKVDIGVSIAGVDFDFLWFLSGTDMNQSKTVTQWTTTATPEQFGVTSAVDEAGDFVASQLTVASSAAVGSGSRFQLSGSIGGATITSYTYFNLAEGYLNDWYDYPSLENALKRDGSYALICEGCDIFWSSEYILVEGLSLFNDCLVVDAAIDFDCCGFGDFDILFKDIILGAFGVDFDFLVTFTTNSKTMTLQPEIELVGACIDLIIDIDMSGNSLTGIEILGLEYSQDFGGVDVGFAATWDYSENPLVGSYGYLSHTYGGSIYYWIPDTRGRDLSTATLGVVDTNGAGVWNIASSACYYEKAYVYNKMTLGIDGDSCCGGLFDVSVDTYFGEIKGYTLTGVYGTYYYDDVDTTVDLDFLGAANAADQDPDFTTAPDAWSAAAASTVDCLPCPAGDPAVAVESVMLSTEYAETSVTGDIFGWIESDIDLSFAVGSGVTLTMGVDVRWWGWNTLDFGITFEW